MECIDSKCTWIWGALCSLLVYKPLPRMKWRAPGNSTFLSNSFDNNPLSPWCMARLYQTQTHIDMCKNITVGLEERSLQVCEGWSRMAWQDLVALHFVAPEAISTAHNISDKTRREKETNHPHVIMSHCRRNTRMTRITLTRACRASWVRQSSLGFQTDPHRMRAYQTS